MNARQRRTHRRNQIVEVCRQLRSVQESAHGLGIDSYNKDNLYEIVMECCSFDYMSDPEKRLAVVSFEEGMTAAKASIWYK